MHIWKYKKSLLIITILALSILLLTYSTRHAAIDFNTQVKPILNKKCITCHGGVKQQGNFSVLFRSEALAITKSGKAGIIPGDPEHSEMIRRLKLKDPEERMPYHHEPLSADEINTLIEWIRQGAKWGNHWAYVPVHEVAVPQPENQFFNLIKGRKWGWAKNDIDHFIYQKLLEQHIKPSPEADKQTLLRRVSMDLIGLPAPDPLAQQYLQSNDDKGYERLVDSLLALPYFGEKWTSMWLDLARYADTKGYERDAGRSIWPYRDWLIKAFNQDKPYDQFLIEQLAGDLIPNATDDQFIATAFHRNTMTNDEGGTDNEEFRTAAVLDRVNTTWQGLLGTTFACVQCHSHPYDPFTHDEYYKFMAFFNDTRDEDTQADYPLLCRYDGKDSSRLLKLTEWLKQNNYASDAQRVYQFLKTWQPSINSIQTDSFTNCELNDTKWLALRNHATARLKHVNLDEKTALIYRYQGLHPGGVWTIHLDKADGPVLQKVLVTATKGWSITHFDFSPVKGWHNLYFAYTNPGLKKPEESGMMFDWFYFTKPLPGKEKQGFAAIQQTYWELLAKGVPTIPVMMDNPWNMHRSSYVFERGNWLVKGKEVQADVPHALNPLPKNAIRNRMSLARWLTDKRNPLTARTMVNRLWEQLFGTGIVETLEDLGTQGAEPTHKELLDFLSWRFMNDDHWSMKKMLREIVLSATYRQSSKVNKELLEKDPYNKLYARGARVRLSAEQIRDQALAVSGLLSKKMYGPSVMPWQPDGIWMSPWNGDYWKTSEGEDQYRRGVYTFWKRTAPYPSMITFDGAGREVCTVRRIRTNTPLQALATLNDSVYLIASRAYAYRMQNLVENKSDVRAMISKGYELAMLKPVTAARLTVLENLYQQALAKFKANPERAGELVGEKKDRYDFQIAALVVIANALLNMDEMITKN